MFYTAQTFLYHNVGFCLLISFSLSLNCNSVLYVCCNVRYQMSDHIKIRISLLLFLPGFCLNISRAQVIPGGEGVVRASWGQSEAHCIIVFIVFIKTKIVTPCHIRISLKRLPLWNVNFRVVTVPGSDGYYLAQQVTSKLNCNIIKAKSLSLGNKNEDPYFFLSLRLNFS